MEVLRWSIKDEASTRARSAGWKGVLRQPGDRLAEGAETGETTVGTDNFSASVSSAGSSASVL